MYNCISYNLDTLHKNNLGYDITSSNEQSALKCKYCFAPYKKHGPLTNHQNKCSYRDTYETSLESSNKILTTNIDSIIKEKDNIIKEKDNLLMGRDLIILELKAEIAELKTHLYADRKDINEIAKNASIQVTNNSISVASESALKYITKNFPNAPVLERKDIPKLLEYDNAKEPDQDKLAEEWICAEKTGSLVPSIGKIIINIYKPDDPAFQPVWNSDVERLTFYRRALNDKKVGTWVTDKKGIDTSNQIIKPMLAHIEQQLIAYNKKHPTPEEIQKLGQIIMEHVETSHKIISRLRDGQLETAVLRFCAPHFSINKTKELPSITKALTYTSHEIPEEEIQSKDVIKPKKTKILSKNKTITVKPKQK
jgi:hypothetical protein